MTNVETDPAATKATVAPAARHTAPRKAAAKKARASKTAQPTATATILSLVARKQGASLSAIMEATGWQAHSVRGFLSLAHSKRGLKIESAKNAKGERVYMLAK